MDSIRCPICDGDLESEDHLFVSCVIAVDIWKNILNWWRISNMCINSFCDVINLVDLVPLEPKHSNLFDVVVQTALWSMWRLRNNMAFSQKRSNKCSFTSAFVIFF